MVAVFIVGPPTMRFYDLLSKRYLLPDFWTEQIFEI